MASGECLNPLPIRNFGLLAVSRSSAYTTLEKPSWKRNGHLNPMVVYRDSG